MSGLRVEEPCIQVVGLGMPPETMRIHGGRQQLPVVRAHCGETLIEGRASSG